jgi:diaminopimelate epimerase
MIIPFFKYQGTGNDFIMIDNRVLGLDNSFIEQVPSLCHRHFGIGADGVILIQNHPDYDFEMVYYNPDGSQSLCGNGSRCAVAFAAQLGIIKNETTFLAIDGPHYARIEHDKVFLQMGDVSKIEAVDADQFANTGSPHHLVWKDNLDGLDVQGEGRKIRYSDRYQPKGTNVNFLKAESDNCISIRTYERGVEDETWSCGTGVTAAALAAATKGMKSPVRVLARGGELAVKFQENEDGSFSQIELIGPANYVFQGQIII